MEAQNFSVLLKELREKQVAGTRTWVIDLVRAWLDDPRGARLFGVTGDAGMGKSAPRRRGDATMHPDRHASKDGRHRWTCLHSWSCETAGRCPNSRTTSNRGAGRHRGATSSRRLVKGIRVLQRVQVEHEAICVLSFRSQPCRSLQRWLQLAWLEHFFEGTILVEGAQGCSHGRIRHHCGDG